MNERFTLQNDEAAPESGAAFIFVKKSGLKVRINRFRTLKQLDAYAPQSVVMPVRNLPVLLEPMPNSLTDKNLNGVLKRMVDWYYYIQIRA